MKAKLIGTALFVLTAAAVAYPALKSSGSINTAPIDVTRAKAEQHIVHLAKAIISARSGVF